MVDLPLEESNEYLKQCNINNIEPICLIAPSTRRQKVQKIAYHCHAFLYYVCRNGTTGVKNSLPKDYVEKLSELRTISNHPIVSGFGIGNRKLAAKVVQHADGFVVGSAFVSAITHGANTNDLQQLAAKIDPR